MYRGFKISDISIRGEQYYEAGLDITANFKEQVTNELEEYLSPDGAINGGLLESDWFPQIKADIFISHSHADEHLAFALAGWLNRSFGLKCFVDSGVWGHADSLLKKIDDRFCMFPDSTQYNYEKRNKSTSLVHMILGMAIAKLIYRTECLFLLNTPNSVQPNSAIVKSETHSPWLYYEAGLSLLLRKPLSYYRPDNTIEKAKEFSERAVNETVSFEVMLPLATEHLISLDSEHLNHWRKEHSNKLEEKVHPLDTLYELF